jgi:hypothetical protein
VREQALEELARAKSDVDALRHQTQRLALQLEEKDDRDRALSDEAFRKAQVLAASVVWRARAER